MHRFMLVFILLCYGLFPLHGASSASSHAVQGKIPPPLKEQFQYAIVGMTPPVLHTDTLRLDLTPDEAQCRKAYGTNWQERCRIAPGSDGARIKGMRLTPDIPGTWRWEGVSTLVFQPEVAWPLATRLDIALDGVLPSRIRLNKTTLSLTTPALAALIEPGQVWVDPAPQGERAVSFDILFNSPPDQARIRDVLNIQTSTPALKTGRPELIWSADGTRCLLKIALQALPPEEATLKVTLAGMQRLIRTGERGEYRESGETWQMPPKQVAGQSLGIPGTAGLFRVEQVNLRTVRTPGLAPEQQLELKTSLRVRPSELLRALKTIQLPRVNQPEATRPYAWDVAPAVTPEDLNAGTVLRPQSLQPDDAPLNVLRFSLPATADSYVFVSLPEGFGPTPALTLARPWRQVMRVSASQAEVRFLQSGQVLTPNGAGKIDLVASGLTAITWQAARVLDPFLGFLAGRTENFAYPYVDPAEISDARSGDLTLAPAAAGQPQFAALDVGAMLPDRRGLMALTLTGIKDGKKVCSVQRFVLVTDMGMLVKTAADGTSDVFVCSLSGHGPITNATVSILGLNGRPVASARTDAQGHAYLPSVAGLDREKTPVAIVAEQDADSAARNGQNVRAPLKARDMAWLPLRDAGREIDYSRFAIQGQTGSADGINAYVFAERGMFRPGETLRLGCMIRRGDWQPLPAALPLTATLTDPAGRTVMERTFTVGDDGLAEFFWPAHDSAPTGRYRLDITAPTPGKSGQRDVLGSGVVRVEEFQPDTLAMTVALTPKPTQGWLDTTATTRLNTRVHLKNLYGLPAADRRIRARLTTSPALLRFSGHADYIFQSAGLTGDTLDVDLPEVHTDAQGLAIVPLDVERLPGGARQYSLLIEGFEPGGGRAVSERTSFLAAPCSTVLGYALRGAVTNPDFIPQHAQGSVQFLALNAALESVTPGPLHVTLSQRRTTTSLITDANGRFRYDETLVEHKLASATVTPAADGSLIWPLPTDTPGDYIASVRDARNTIRVDVPFTVAGNDDLRTLTEERLPPATVRLRLDRTDANPGDTVQAFISIPYDGTGLLTLERDRVVSHTWFTAKAGNSVQKLVIPQDFEGRGYVNLSIIRAHDAPEIFMQPHSYAIAPLTVNIAGRDMGLRLKAPAHVQPGQQIEAVLTATAPGRAVVFAVDEGVLQLTRFATPDPLAHLLLDRALEVRTRQMLDLLMPDHSQLQKIIPAFGGDAAGPGGRFLNPFKRKSEPPLSWWSSFVDVSPAGTRVSIPVPDYYNGRVRIMAVGGTAVTSATTGKAGRAETGVTVSGPLVLTPQVPVMATPGDTFHASLAIASNLEHGPETFALTLDADPALTVVQAPPAMITLSGGAETVVPFVVQAADIPGNATLRFTVTGPVAGTTATTSAKTTPTTPVTTPTTVRREASLSIRPPVPAQSALLVGKATGSATVATPRTLYPYMATGSASVSTVPLPALRGLVRYLDTYPYGCVEQLISRAFPVAVLSRMPDMLTLGSDPRTTDERLRTLTAHALQAIQGALIHGRGIAAWTYSTEPVPLLTAYAADYLLSLRDAGLATPDTLLSDVCDALDANLDRDPTSLVDARAMAYGIWVLTREGRITTRAIERLTAQLEGIAPDWRADITGTLLAGSLAIMRQTAPARALIAAYTPPDARFESVRGFDPLVVDALRVAVLARHFPDLMSDEADTLADRMLDVLKAGYTSFSAAQGIRALSALPDAPQDLSELVSLRCTAMQPGFSPSSDEPVALHGMLSLQVPGCASYSISSTNASLPLYWEVSDSGFSRSAPTQAAASGLEITRAYFDENGQPLTAATLGQIVTVRLTLRTISGSVDDVVAIDMLPGGFEMLLDAAPADFPGRVERREDRLLVFADLEGVATGTYKIRAVNRGSYTVPAARIEAMYDNTLFGHTAGSKIDVK